MPLERRKEITSKLFSDAALRRFEAFRIYGMIYPDIHPKITDFGMSMS
jgi:hypothetical protein